MNELVNLYQSTYSHFEEGVLKEIRLETYGTDIGQNSWTTADEYRQFASWLNLSADSHVLEIGCGTGGPANYLSQISQCYVTGTDVSADGIAQAKSYASSNRKLRFLQTDGTPDFPFLEDLFDAIICIDAINHIPEREKIFSSCYRVLKPGGKILFSDPVVISDLISFDELKVRSSIGYFVFPIPGVNDRLLETVGFEMERIEDGTENMAQVSIKWKQARERKKEALLKVGSPETYYGLQDFLTMVNMLANNRKLRRIIYLANKPSN
jgi:SAM-dependent methyltransferase